MIVSVGVSGGRFAMNRSQFPSRELSSPSFSELNSLNWLFATRRSSSKFAISLSICHALCFSSTSSAFFIVPSGLKPSLLSRILTPPPFAIPPLNPLTSRLSGYLTYSAVTYRTTLTLYIISFPLILRCAVPNAPCLGFGTDKTIPQSSFPRHPQCPPRLTSPPDIKLSALKTTTAPARNLHPSFNIPFSGVS